MSKHIFGMVLTGEGIYANNRGENEGSTNTLQKILKNGELYTTVSAESIRYALRDVWQEWNFSLNRTTVDHRSCRIADRTFQQWPQHLDDDVLGFMHATQETVSRRGLLEISRAISTTPWRGEIMHSFASPGSNPGVTHTNPIPYAVEVHNTRYQYGFALTPELLGGQDDNGAHALSFGEKKSRVQQILNGLTNLRRVGGNHARYLTDFAPDVLILRWTDDPVPRFLNCFQCDEHNIFLPQLIKKVEAEDIEPQEIIIGNSLEIPDCSRLEKLGVTVLPGIKAAVSHLMNQIKEEKSVTA
jgi:CRISPR-associated protein Cst2